jgi:hypothetical protein
MRDQHKQARERTQWWKHSRSVQELFDAVKPLPRFIACPAQSKRITMVWCQPDWCPGNTTSVFAFADDYAFGVLSSRIHTRWATDRSTHLETRPRYTVRSFATFPWPGTPSAETRSEIEQLAVAIDGERRTICSEREIGLTTLYNAVEEGAHATLRDLHLQLDKAVSTAYGWPPSVASDPGEQESRLCELNREITAGEHPDYEGPG